MTVTREEHDRALWLDQEAQVVKCATCGAPLRPEHGMISVVGKLGEPISGVTWWQCPNPNCGRRIREDYEYQPVDNIIVSKAVEEV